MGSKKFDPNKITGEDIFRAKEERRKELAKLPFEKKIEIVKRLNSVALKFQKSERGSKDEPK